MNRKTLQLSELITALSYALDMTEGQPKGHCIRCYWIGMHLGQELAQVIDVFNCSSGKQAALREVKGRSNSWFDPKLVDAFLRVTMIFGRNLHPRK